MSCPHETANARSPTRRSRWRFSLRELLLVALVIAAFLGWGHAMHRRYAGLPATPMSAYFLDGFGKDVVALLRETAGTEPDFVPGVGAGSSGPATRSRTMFCNLPLASGDAEAFVDALYERVRERLAASGCQESVVSGTGTEHEQGFNLHYRYGAAGGSLLVYVVRIDAMHARLIAVLDEHRAP